MIKKTFLNPLPLLAVVVALTFLSSCEKSPEKTIIGEWAVINREEKSNSNPNWTKMADCWLDDVETFTKDGNWELYLGTNWCSGQTNGVTKGKYSITSSGSRIAFTYEKALGEYYKDIFELSESTMVVLYNVGDLNNTQNRITYRRK